MSHAVCTRERAALREGQPALRTQTRAVQVDDVPSKILTPRPWCPTKQKPVMTLAAGRETQPARVISPLGYGIRSLTLLSKPVMTEDEITVFPPSISGPPQKEHQSGDGKCDPDDRHLTSRESVARRRPMYPAWRGRRRRYIDQYVDRRKSWIRSSSHSRVAATSFAADDRLDIGEEAPDLRWRPAW
jgi:hypothetical protein